MLSSQFYSLRRKNISLQNTGTDRAKGEMSCKIIAAGRHPTAKSSLWSCFTQCDMTQNPRNGIFAEKKALAAAGKTSTGLIHVTEFQERHF